MIEYKIIKDTREKKGWDFTPDKNTRKSIRCIGQIVSKLNTGDYSVEGYESLISIEKKSGFGEVWSNFLSDKKRFEDVCIRLNSIKYRYIMIETLFTRELLDFCPAQVRRVVLGKAVLKWLYGLSIKYDIPVLWVGSHGMDETKLIIESMLLNE